MSRRGEQLLVRAALDDATAFEDENLVGVHDRREAVGDDERGAVAAERAQPFSNE